MGGTNCRNKPHEHMALRHVLNHRAALYLLVDIIKITDSVLDLFEVGWFKLALFGVRSVKFFSPCLPDH